MRIVWTALAIAGALAAAGCKQANSAEATPTAKVRQAMDDKNYGSAARLAADAVAASPHDPQLRFLQAKAEAQLGNGGNAARALDTAATEGLPNPGGAADDIAFDPVRADPGFSAVADRLKNRSSTTTSAADARPHRSSVQIDGDTVRAGDVSVSLDH